MKKIYTTFYLILFAVVGFAQGFRIDISIPQLANQEVYLAGYLNGKIYSKDTTKLDPKGVGFFSDKEKLDEGLYMIYLHENHVPYEFLIGADDQEFAVTIKDTTSQAIIDNFAVVGASQTEKYLAVGRYISDAQKKQKHLVAQLKDAKKGSKEEENLKKELSNLNDQVLTYQKNLIESNENNMLAVFLRAMQQPTLPDSLAKGDFSDENFQRKRYMYAKAHFFDNIDVADVRSWRINVLHKKLTDFLTKWLPQHPDTITQEAIKLIEKTESDSMTFSLMTNFMISHAVSSKMMGMDRLLVELSDRYYSTGKAFWADSTILSNVLKEANKSRYNLIGMQARNMPLVKHDGTPFHLYDIKSKYTLLYFYEPSCGHCKVATPKLYNNVYQQYKNKGLEVVAVYLMTDKKEWDDFLNEHKMTQWINAWDPNRDSYYWQFFDTSTTPSEYLLDANKKIIAKRFGVESLGRIIDMFDEMEKEKEK